MRRLVIEGERVGGAGAQSGDAAFHVDHAGGASYPLWLHPVRQASGCEGVLREGMEDVGDQQFLVLLLMLQAEFDQVGCFCRQIVERSQHRAVHCLAVGADRGRVRAGEQAAGRAWMAFADGLIVGVEQYLKAWVMRAVARDEGHRDEGLEEPGGVGAVPLRRACIGHGLHALVFWREAGRQHFGVRAGAYIGFAQSAAPGGDPRAGFDHGHAGLLARKTLAARTGAASLRFHPRGESFGATCGDLRRLPVQGAGRGEAFGRESVALYRWLGVLIVLTVVTALLSLGVIPSGAAGMAHMLLGAYATLLAISLIIGIILM